MAFCFPGKLLKVEEEGVGIKDTLVPQKQEDTEVGFEYWLKGNLSQTDIVSLKGRV